ncbi:patatin-like phospholipase family protein [Clostridium paraputrificum]|uniref:patatin-like phospholipase family protein n=1 Tax=Clostridium TaxID=1485 RepID=UPI003D32836C
MKIGMVLAGGGALGSYQIGVWRALKELKVDEHIKIISGTSIGALNAILFMQGDIDNAEELWYSISKEKVLPTDNKDLFARGILIALGSKNMGFVKKYIPKALEAGNISRSGLLDIIEKYVDFDKVIKKDIICYATCTEIPDLVPRYFKVNEHNIDTITSILLATSALPMIYESEKIQEKQYLDGGLVDNVPIQPVYGEGCDLIIVVNLYKDATIDKRMYPNTKFIEITPRIIDEGFVDGVLDFKPESARRRIRQGYEDTIEQFTPFYELYKFISEIEMEKVEKSNIVKYKNKKMIFNLLKEKILNKRERPKNKEI